MTSVQGTALYPLFIFASSEGLLPRPKYLLTYLGLGAYVTRINFLTRTNFIREGLPKGGHSSTRTRGVP